MVQNFAKYQTLLSLESNLGTCAVVPISLCCTEIWDMYVVDS